VNAIAMLRQIVCIVYIHRIYKQ